MSDHPREQVGDPVGTGGDVGPGATPGAHGGGVALALRRHPVLSALGAFAAILIGFVAWSVVWYEGQLGGSAGGARTIVTVSQGSSVSDITSRLASRHVIGSTLAFRIYLTLHGTPLVQAGGYLLRR